MDTIVSIPDNKENVDAATPSGKTQRLSMRLKKSAGRAFDEVRDSLNRPSSSRRNSDVDLAKSTPEKASVSQKEPSTDGKGSVGKKKLSWRGLSSTLKNSLRRTFHLGSESVSEAHEDCMELKTFAVDLDQLLLQERICQVSTVNTGVPHIVHECLARLIPEHDREEGLFRISGMQDQIQALKRNADSARPGTFTLTPEDSTNPHNLTGLLKLFIRELPTSLYPTSMHTALVETSLMEDKSERAEAFYKLAKTLPDSPYCVLKKITCMLNDLLENVEHTKMTAANLSTVWAPNLMWNKQMEKDPQVLLQFSREVNLAVQCTIEEAHYMFKDEIPNMDGQPKRRSLFDLDAPIDISSESHSGSSRSSSFRHMEPMSFSEFLGGGGGGSEQLTPRDASESGSEMESSNSTLSGGSARLTPTQSMPFEAGSVDEMAALANSTRKRPRSIWRGTAPNLPQESESSSNLVSQGSSGSLSVNTSILSSLKFKRGSSKRKSRVSSDAESVSESVPAAKRVKPATISEEVVHTLTPAADYTAGDMNTTGDVNTTDDKMDIVAASAVPTGLAASSSNASSPRKSLRASIRKSLRIGRTSKTPSTVMGQNGQQVLLYYYTDTDPNSIALKKLLGSMHLIPMEIRNAEKDPMSMAEMLFFASKCYDVVLVKCSDKAFTVSHQVSELSEAELASMLINEAGVPKSPAIIVGSTLMVGFEKNLKDVFRYYIQRKPRATTTPILI